MSSATTPIQMCDSEDGCTAWECDIWETGGRYLNPSDDPLSKWAIDRNKDFALCPDHKPEVTP